MPAPLDTTRAFPDGSALHREQSPHPWYALEFVVPTVLELDA
jgi:hypothetical protein